MATALSKDAKAVIPPGRLDDAAWAWAPYEPDAARPWNLQLAGHLFRRAAFGASWDQLQEALAAGPQRTIDKLLRPAADVAAFNRTHDAYEKGATDSMAAEGLQPWWLRRMMETPHPLLEKLTLFWHDHFAIGNARVESALLMSRHVQSLRRHALGNFATLLEAATNDPAVFACLEARANRKLVPSEFFARVLLEQFTVGAGHFAEKDVREAARAFTGWFVLQNELHFIEREQDAGAKKFLGQDGNFAGKDIVRLLLQQPATAQRLVGKLYRWFISETTPPPEALIAPLAARFAKDHDVAKVVEAMLRSNLFHSTAAYRQKVKSPVEFALGIVKMLDGTTGTARLGGELAELGQDLYHPPTIKGWAGERFWINRATLAGRAKLAQALLAGASPHGGQLDPWETARKHGHSSAPEASRFLVELFLQGDLPDAARAVLLDAGSAAGGNAEGLRQFTALVAALPEFHLT